MRRQFKCLGSRPAKCAGTRLVKGVGGRLVLAACTASVAAQIDSPGGASLKLNNDPGGPAPRHQLDGAWVGPTDRRPITEEPQLTALGQERFKLNKPEAAFHVAGSNDPFVRTCDPLGFPRDMLFEMRSVPLGEMLRLTFASLPGRILVLTQFQQTWRQIWIDGRALPANIGGRQKGAPDSRYYGYSVGHWESDNVLMVDTVGLDDDAWMTKFGYPHTPQTHIRETYTRSSHNDLKLTITVDDPKLYVKPFVLATNNFKWLPDQSLDQDEQVCIPSQVIDYIKTVGDQAP
jgi:hypothetical protein